MVSLNKHINVSKNIPLDYPLQLDSNSTTMDNSTYFGYAYIISLIIVNGIGMIDSPLKVLMALGSIGLFGIVYLNLD